MDGVDRVLWSEEVFSVPVDPENVLSSFKRMWKNNHYQNNFDGNDNGSNNGSRRRKSNVSRKKYY
jgi:hypothetical protein